MGRPRKERKGLGDTIEAAIKATGLDTVAPKDCGCEKRKEWLNRVFPYVMKEKGTMNDEQKEIFGKFIINETDTLSPKDQAMIHSLYNSVFQVNTKPCSNCGATEWKRMILKLKEVYKKSK